MTEIYPCGTLVKPKLNNMEGLITCVSIRFGRVSYEISYFLGGDYKVIWLAEEEFNVEHVEKHEIGFKK